MKEFKPLKYAQLIMVIFFATLIVSCNMETNKSTSGDATEKAAEPSSAEVGEVDVAFCDTEVDNHHGCVCAFTDAKGGDANIFMSNMDKSKSACITINGKTEIVTGERMDDREDHFRHSHIPDWIVLDPDGDVHIFNELVDDANYEENKKMIAETMMVMHDLPTEVMIRKNDDGGKVSAELTSRYETMWQEALDYATAEREKGNHGEPIEIALSNDTYDITVTGKVDSHNEDGSDTYSGSIEVKNKSGKVIGTRDFTGKCQCLDS